MKTEFLTTHRVFRFIISYTLVHKGRRSRAISCFSLSLHLLFREQVFCRNTWLQPPEGICTHSSLVLKSEKVSNPCRRPGLLEPLNATPQLIRDVGRRYYHYPDAEYSSPKPLHRQQAVITTGYVSLNSAAQLYDVLRLILSVFSLMEQLLRWAGGGGR